MRLLPNHAALKEKRTIHTKYVKPVNQDSVLLKSVALNTKVGKKSNIIVKSQWRGLPMFSLTLQERKTCPTSCERWDNCYGNATPFAHRFEHGKKLTNQLWIELTQLSRDCPLGFVVRLHILGDFYSVAYVEFWHKALRAFPKLRVFGYTARENAILRAIWSVRESYPDRFWVRESRSKDYDPSEPNRIYAGKPGLIKNGIVCPEMTGKTKSCLTCGLCWSNLGLKSIIFPEH